MSRLNAFEVRALTTVRQPLAVDTIRSRRTLARWLVVLLNAASIAVWVTPAWADGPPRPEKADQRYRSTHEYAEKTVVPLPTVAPVKPKQPYTVTKQVDTKVHGIAGPGPVSLNPQPIPPGHPTVLRTLPGPAPVSLNPQPIPPGHAPLVHEQGVHPQALH